MVVTKIAAGICGFHTTAHARSDDMQNVTLEVTSTCEKISAMAAGLGIIDAYQEIGAGFDGIVLTAARATLRGCCAGCVVPAGLFKTVQVAGGVALPAVASITMERED